MTPYYRKRSGMLNVVAAVSVVFFLAQHYILLHSGNDVEKEEAFVVNFDKNDTEVTTPSSNENAKSEDCTKEKDETPSEPKKINEESSNPDGSFNTFPIYHREVKEGWHSNVHCIGENFSDDAWKYRSCHFQNLCYDIEENSYAIFTSPEQIELEKALQHSKLVNFDPASSMKTTVSLGGVNPKWNKDVVALKWYPKILPVEEIQSTGYYALGTDKVLLPYHSLAGFNPGHLVWDDFLPIYTLLSIFGLVSKELVLMRMNVEPAMWASCQRKYSKCAPIIKKFYPLLGIGTEKVSTQNDTQVEIQGEKKSKYICAPNGAAGMGMLTDHGLKLHGWRPMDYENMHNHGRGASVYAFRNWMMENIGIAPETKKIHNAPYKIIISKGSSSQPYRSVTFEKHSQLLKQNLGSKYKIDVMEVVLAKMPLKDQIELVSGASIFITVCGGGAITAMFLPKGAAVFAYFNEGDGDGGTPARLDWDLLNNMGYIRTHWLPRPIASKTRKGIRVEGPGEHDFDAFVKLVEHELDVISHTNDV